MKECLKILADYCKKNPLDHGDAESAMEVLYWHYTECNPIDNQKIRGGFAKLRRQFPNLSLQDFDPIFLTVSDLCMEHERLAFYEGLRLGMTLVMELTSE